MTLPVPQRTVLATASPALALTPLDGRYREAVAPLIDHLSEAALNRERTHVEIEWLIHLTDTGALPGARKLTEPEKAQLRAIVTNFNAENIAELAEIERETIHDVKAVEYFIKRQLEGTSLAEMSEIVHIFCTSEDINNLSYALMVQGAVREVWAPAMTDLVAQLSDMARAYRDVPMLSRTHGQPATPSTLGKEIAVWVHRLQRQVKRATEVEVLGKINGATGTYAAHAIAVPETDWVATAESFVTHLGLVFNPLTTQIESHDWQAEIYQAIAHANRILHNVATDVWTYISLGYFSQRLSAQGGTGSSTMPHKVNPIRFENAEANLEIANALFDTLNATLTTSRLQRDLTDSTTQRNIAPAFGHTLLSISNISRGLKGLDVDAAAMAADLDGNWEVLGEAVQSAMRALAVAGASGMENPYERLKELTRGRRVTGDDMREFIGGLGLPAEVENRLKSLTPATYVGLAPQLVDNIS